MTSIKPKKTPTTYVDLFDSTVVDTGGTGTGGAVTPTTMSYEEYLNSQKQTAIDNAATARDRQINAAQVGYNQARSVYGSQAAALSGMGLQGSGYSQYLDSQAYAQKNAAIANAYKTEANAVNAAESDYNKAYQNYLQQQEEGRTKAFSDVIQDIGSYSLSDIDYLNGVHKFTPDQIKYLTDGILKGGNYTKADLDNAKGKGYIDQPTYDTYAESLKNTRFDTEKLFLKDDGSKMDKDQAMKVINGLEAIGYSPEAIQEARDAFAVQYGSGIRWNNDNGFLFFGSTEVGKKGNNFSVVDADGHKYRVQYDSGKIDHDTKIYENAPINVNHAVFAYDGQAYIVMNKEVYRIGARDNTYKDGSEYGYAALLKKLGIGV